jgi:hypothetical protein
MSTTQVAGIADGHMTNDLRQGRVRQFNGKMHFVTFATTSMDGPTAPKKHSLRDGAKFLPIALILHQHSTRMTAQYQM